MRKSPREMTPLLSSAAGMATWGELQRYETTISLAPNPQSLDELPVSLHILIFQIVEQLSSAADHSEKTVPGMGILLMKGQVLAERLNPRAQKGNLDLWRAGILLMKVKFFNPVLFWGKTPRHASTPFSTRMDDTTRLYPCKAQSAGAGWLRMSLARRISSATCAFNSSGEVNRTSSRILSQNVTRTDPPYPGARSS